ncbi:hypothetical protein [Croceicoccus sp. YJ47]|uniref:hypothetical protein n=1 Tax=Croceicoccus sp. YJ47 TaxID=2798724 RepID=UPI001922E72F|nr:hypothetical protein [Croceicoccus sp. YJ47]QQN74246.1 hypothetical protein JD971_16320 [Croceicoccus sp. YJ47]
MIAGGADAVARYPRAGRPRDLIGEPLTIVLANFASSVSISLFTATQSSAARAMAIAQIRAVPARETIARRRKRHDRAAIEGAGPLRRHRETHPLTDARNSEDS